MNARQTLYGAAILAAAAGCRMDVRDSDNSLAGLSDIPDVTGTYVAADSGKTLGKNWCYSGALVLDSTHHFGSVLTMCSDEGTPVTEHIKGTYHLKTITTKVGGNRRVLRRLDVILDQDGRGKSHTLRYDAGNLRFREPWILGAGLRALEIPDPVLKKVAVQDVPDSIAARSSTPATLTPPSPKSAARKSTKIAAVK